MTDGLITSGPASAYVGISSAIPEAFRHKVREVSALHVEKDSRRSGHGTGLMRKICADADCEGLTLLVCVGPSDDDGMTHEQLAHWYHSLGFREIQPDPLLMARTPQPIIQLLH